MLLLSLVLEWVYALNVTTCKIIVIIICLTMGVHAECDRSQHSCCHYVLFYSEYIILLNVPGHTIHGVIISCFIVDVWAECKTSHHSWCYYHVFLSFFTGRKSHLQERKSHARHLLSTRVKRPLWRVTSTAIYGRPKTTSSSIGFSRWMEGVVTVTHCTPTFSQPVKRYSRFLLCLCILNQSVYLLGMTPGVSAWA